MSNKFTVSQVSKSDLFEQLKLAYRDADRAGRNWHYVRVAADGSVYHGEEVSPCWGEDEYFGRAPHTITVWSTSANYSSTPHDGTYLWDECEESEAEFWADEDSQSWSRERDETHTRPCRFGGMTDDTESGLMEEVERIVSEKLEAVEWLEVVE